ncbi:hypothetical protein GCM10023328_30370 [Modestobacter marinus]|uniref:ABC-type Mn/Zn transport systems, ATPase component n=1 Tax=Modestobacter marinus TaxID=477641 RepID=A0A846LCW5_9ACTN|nr:hypothetical protein [Modestobacter marinus]NIH65963.1 hypothetical protein [Modestobacter marinus]GGL68504.1 hypothetical protein GCM10011589_26030 [Modestobacter marinus]
MSNDQHTVLRSMHDLGLAAWFGGNLMGAVGLNKAAAAARDRTERTRLSSIGWGAWSPVQGAAIAAHLIGSVGMLRADRGRVGTGPGAMANTVVKSVLTVAAIGTSVASGALGAKIGAESPVPSRTATTPAADTPSDVAGAQKAQKPLQWVNPALTGVLVVLAAQQGEQQRTSSTVRGALGAGLASVKAAVLRAS